MINLWMPASKSESIMLLVDKEAVMTVPGTLDFVAFNLLTNNNPIAVLRRNLMAKIDEEI